MKELLHDTGYTLKNYVLNILATMESVANPFYLELNQEAWANFDLILNALEWSDRVVDGLIGLEYDFNKKDLIEIKNQMEIQLSALLLALENKEYILVGDLLLYEINPILEHLVEYITGNLEEQGNEV